MQYSYTNEQEVTATIRVSYRDVCQLLKIIEQVEDKKWYHDDMISDLKEIRKSMAQSMKNFYAYQVESAEADSL